jgi:single-stranded-DNA-specific exonuclease
MSTLQKRWRVAPALSPEHLSHYAGLSSILAQVLANRGFQDPETALRFLRADDLSAGAFLQIRGRNRPIDRAVSRIQQAIRSGEKIVVYGDFDADGVTSTVLLVQVLRALGAAVNPYIPNRVDEGYGLNSEALLRLARAGVKLVVTVDCGIRSGAEVEDGKAYGLDIIVTDHHSVGPELPRAHAVINPKDTSWPYSESMLAGVGVAYRLAEALLTVAQNGSRRGSVPLEKEELLDLVAIGTVADLAPMDRIENRAFVREGLKRINEARRPGVRALLEVAGLKPGAVTAMSIGFALGPRINAAGRLDSAMIAYELLSAEDDPVALRLAQQLQDLNTERQDLTRAAQELIRTRIEAEYEHDIPLIFAGDRGFKPGIVGLVAGRLTEEYFRPAVVMELGDDESRASCRSIPEFDITHALDQCADLLVRHGGHAQAAGFTVKNQNIPALRSRLTELAFDRLSGQELRPTLEIDAEADIHQLSESLVNELALLEPTGYKNPAPVLMSRNLRVLEARTVGKDHQHLRLKLARAGQPPLDAIGFGLGGWCDRIVNHRLDAAYMLEINEWNGYRSLQLNLQDIRLSEG